MLDVDFGHFFSSPLSPLRRLPLFSMLFAIIFRFSFFADGASAPLFSLMPPASHFFVATCMLLLMIFFDLFFRQLIAAARCFGFFATYFFARCRGTLRFRHARCR